MSERVVEKTKQITELESTIIELKRQVLEKEKKFQRYKRELQFQMEKERASWKAKEDNFNVRLKQVRKT